MVDLPQVPRRLTTIQTPQSNVQMMSEAAAAAPYRMLAKQLDMFGDTLNTVAIAAAPEAGRQSVARDETGNLTITPLPVVGPAAAPYARSIKVSAVAEAELDVNSAVAEMRQQFKADPASFEEAIKEYRKEKVAQFNSIGGTQVGNAIGQIINRVGTWHLRGLMFEKQRKDLKDAKSRLKVSADAKSDDLVDLARAGAVESEDFANVQSDYVQVLDEAASNTLLAFTPDEARSHADATMQRGRRASLIGSARRAYESGGQEAVAELMDRVAPQANDPMRRAVAFDIDAMEGEREAEKFAELQATFATNDRRLNEGVLLAANGGLDQSWLDRNGDRLGRRSYETLRAAVNVAPPSVSDPSAEADLFAAAIGGGPQAAFDAVTAFASGQLTRAAFGEVVSTAIQVGEDAGKRPWANDLRRSVAERTRDIGPGALTEFSRLLAQAPEITRADAQAQADLIVDQFRDRDRRTLAATLSLPSVMRSTPVKADQIDDAQSRLLQSAQTGAMSFDSIARDMALLDDWRRAIKAEA
jgi:hypothetical protein